MLLKNDVIEIANRQYRILCIEPGRNELWLIAIIEANAYPHRQALNELVKLENGGKIKRVPDTDFRVINVSAKAKKHRDVAWERIKPIVTHEDIFSRETRGRLIKQRADELKCSRVTIYKDLKRYWVGGQVKDALLPNHHLSGRCSDGCTANRGRPPKHANYNLYQLTPTDLGFIKNTIKKYYLANPVATKTDAYQRLLENHYSFLDGNGKAFIKSDGEKPTRRQFARVLRDKFPIESIIRRRKSDAEFELNDRARLSSAQADCLGVGHMYEIDATIADVFLVQTRDRTAIIGKPTLYLITDRRSRLLVGFYVGLEPASWPAATQAILSIAEDKAALCARYKVKYDAADWPADGVFPQQFIADRGEFISHNSSLLVDGLGITVTNLPARRADLKGTVEMGFRQTHRTLAETVPGYEPPDNFRKRQGKHYEKDACLTLDEFTSIIIEAIVMHNRTPMPNYPWPPEKVNQGLQPIPRDIWAHEVPERMGILTRYSEERVRFALLPQDSATVTRDGIRFGACFYTCPEAVERSWFTTAGRRAFEVRISYDRRLVDSIYIHEGPSNTKFFRATLIDAKSGMYQGRSFREVEILADRRTQQKHDGIQTQEQNRLEFHEHSDPIAKKALAETRRASKGKSRSARKAATATAREAERGERRQEEARIGKNRHEQSIQPQESAETVELRSGLNFAAETEDAALPESTSNQPTAETDAGPAKPLSLKDKLRKKREEM